MRGSLQLRRYLLFRRNGTPMRTAAEMAVINLVEAAMHDASLAAGEYDDIITNEGDVMTDDAIFTELAVGLSADHQAEKKKRGRPPKVRDALPPVVNGEIVDDDPLGVNEEAEESISSVVLNDTEIAALCVLGDPIHDPEAEAAEEDKAELEAYLNRDKAEANFHSAHEANLDHLATLADAYIADQSALLGSFRDIVLELFRNRRMPWAGMSPPEQRDTVAAIDYAGRAIIQEMVIAVAAKNRPSIPAMFKKLSDDGQKMTLTVEVTNATREDENALHASLRSQVVIVPADWSFYDVVTREAVPDDEPELAFETAPEPTRAEVMGFDANPPEHPEDDGDLAGEDIAPLEEAAPIMDDAATWIIQDHDEDELVYLMADLEAWTADDTHAARFTRQRADDLAFEHGATSFDTAA